MSNKRQEFLDAIKDKAAGTEIIEWKDVKRKSSGDSLYDLGWLDEKKGTSLAKIEGADLAVRQNNFLADLEKQLEPGRNINEYRELKTFLVEKADYIYEQAGLSSADLQDKLDRLDDLIVETNTARYEDALKRLEDNEGFEELEQLQKEYQQAVETMALQSVVQEKLTASTVNLLEILDGKTEKK